jgi:cytochrome d ubiquinol oxidase subunit II
MMTTMIAAGHGYLNLNTLWFALIAVLWIGFFFLEGFDFGVGTLLPFLGKDETDRRVMVNSIGPVWDGNEVWLLVAGGATFAAFPDWYATMFSGFYLALFLVLVALIFRGVAFEFRGKGATEAWTRRWDLALFLGSALPALLFGVAFGNILRGVPIDHRMEYTGSFFTLLNPYSLVAGLTFLALFTMHGAVFLSLKTTDDLRDRSRRAGLILAVPTIVLEFAFLGWTYLYARDIGDNGLVPGPVPIAAILAVAAAGWLLREKMDGWAFVATALSIVLIVATTFLYLYPRVMISSLGKWNDLTIWNTSSTHRTLGVMTIVALVFTPVVLVYQGWTYHVFRKRIGRKDVEAASAH